MPVAAVRFMARPSGRFLRRALTFPAIYLGAVIALALFPIALPLALLVDIVRPRRFALVRCVIFFCGYLLGEAAFITFAGLQWLIAPGWLSFGRPRLARWTHVLARAWGVYLDSFGRRGCFSVRLEVTGREALKGGGPALCFLRHVSVADNLFAPVFFSCEADLDLLYVAKHELQHDPIFDLIGNRIGACFVRRGSGQAAREIGAVTSLLDTVGPRDGIIVYPEGTRFSPEKRERILASIERRGDAVLTARARSLKHVLPPNLGGPVALLERATEDQIPIDVIFCMHAGFEGAATFSDLIDGRAVGRTVRVHFERVPFSELPRGHEALADWFFARWERLDAWVGAELPEVLKRTDRS